MAIQLLEQDILSQILSVFFFSIQKLLFLEFKKPCFSVSCILNLKTVFLALFKLFKINEGLNLYINNNKGSFLYKSSLLLSASFEEKIKLNLLWP